jgi:hypothetical protein
MLLVRKVLLGKVEITILGKKARLDRPFMTTGIIPEKEEPNRKFVSE